MYIDDIEIGNIVNPLGHSIDCGFGLERLVQVMGYNPPTPSEHLLDVLDILSSQGIASFGQGNWFSGETDSEKRFGIGDP